MTRIFLDDVLRNKLHDLTEPIELCDQAGRVVGRVYPAADLCEYELSEPPMSDEELRRLVHSDEKCYSTAEVLKHLESL